MQNSLLVKDVETRQIEKGTEIRVKTENEIALVVESSKGERIYLPKGKGSDSTYYVENTSHLERFSNGYGVVHQGDVDDITVLQ